MPPNKKRRFFNVSSNTTERTEPLKKKETTTKATTDSTDWNIQHLILDNTTRNKYVTKTVEQKRFYYSSNLETVRIHENSGITKIGVAVFEDCFSLRSVHLAGCVERIQRSAFNGCRSLQSIHLADGVKRIDCSAFHCCDSLHSVHVPQSITHIEEKAFESCRSLQSVHIAGCVEKIGWRAFQDCSRLQSVQIEDGANITAIGWGAFQNCTSLHSVHIPNGVTTIGGQAFDGCSSLLSIQIPNTVTTIGLYTFKGCSSLQSIYIPNTVVHIGNWAFACCYNLKQRQTNGTNYHTNIETWLRQRFNDLSIHHECYHANGAGSAVEVDLLSNLIKENKQALAATDAMGMTPLHILCCNPFATVEAVKTLVENDPSLLTRTDVTECTPLQLFLKCRRLLRGYNRKQQETMPSSLSLRNFLDIGISGEDLAILFVLLNDNQEFVTSLRAKDDNTNLFPFMTAATLPCCGLDAIHLGNEELACDCLKPKILDVYKIQFHH